MPDAQDVLWRPHDGPQMAFLASNAYECLYGGAAGGGKSDALLFGAVRQVEHPKYRALILRRTFPELRELMDRALAVFGQIGGTWNEQAKRWKWPSGATVEFGYCETYRDVLQYQGQQFAYIGFDELGQIAEERVWTYLMSRCRASGAGLTLQMRASANPGGPGHYWVKRRFVDVCDPHGKLTYVETLPDEPPLTRAYVRAVLADNPTLVENDPGYASRLRQLPDLEYRWLALGDWSAGGGLAFPELGEARRYLVKVAPIPDHWFIWGAFDWGYNHPFAFGLYGADEDGNVVKIDTVTGRQMQPPAIADRIQHCLATHRVRDRLAYIHAGHDVWADVRARSENIPTLAEQFGALGLPMVKANISRIAGVQNLRRYFALRDNAPPRFRLFDTPGNRKTLDCLASRVCDPDAIEDVLKQDADASGAGGDDLYDETRYGLAARPLQVAPDVPDRVPEDRHPGYVLTKRRLADRRDKWTPDTDDTHRFRTPRLTGEPRERTEYRDD